MINIKIAWELQLIKNLEQAYNRQKRTLLKNGNNKKKNGAQIKLKKILIN